MALTVMLSTTLRQYVPDYNPETGVVINFDRPLTTRELAEKLGLPLPEIRIIMLNGRHAGLEQTVADNDRIGFFPAVGGG